MKKFIVLMAVALMATISNGVFAQTETADSLTNPKALRDAERARQKAAQEIEESAAYAEAVKALEEKQFVLEADQVIFKRGETAYVNTNSTRAGVATIDYGTSGVTVAEGTVFDGNETQASAGGAIKALNGLTIGNGVTFSNNEATGNAWGGGALYIKLANKGTASENTTVSIGENVKIELDANETDVLWRHAGDSNWQVLISKAEITGPQGPQGEKGEPGDAADLGAYSTTEEMNLAIDMAVADVANKYATKEELTAATAGLVTSDDLKRGLQAKADAADVYTKEEVYNKQEVDEKVSDLVGVDMADYVKTEDFNNALGTKADTSYVDAQLANKADVGTVSGLAADVAEAKDLAAGAAIDAANAVGGLATKADTSYVNTQLDTKADKSELGNYAKTSDLAGYATTEQLETKADKSELLNYATTDSVDTKLENYYTISEVDDKVARRLGCVAKEVHGLVHPQAVEAQGISCTLVRRVVA